MKKSELVTVVANLQKEIARMQMDIILIRNELSKKESIPWVDPYKRTPWQPPYIGDVPTAPSAWPFTVTCESKHPRNRVCKDTF